MSWVSIYVHLVFCTKNRERFLITEEIRKHVFQHIKQNAEKKGIWLDCVNGYSEHAHCLVSVNRDQTIAQVAQLVKGELSYWINQNKLTANKFMWQDDYWAMGVCQSAIERTRAYIFNQEEHHRKKTFKEEVDLFMARYGWHFLTD